MAKLKEIDTRKNIKTVTSNDFITAQGLEKLSLKARKMLYVAIAQCKKTDKQFYTYEISVKDFSKLMSIDESNVYKVADDITTELMAGMLQYKPDGAYFKKYSIFSTCEYRHDGILYFKLNPDMTTFLLGLKENFSQPLLEDFLKMNSPYSMAIWHLMQREMHSAKPGITNVINFDLTLKEIREVTGTENKFERLSDIKRFVFDKALREIDENCGVKVTYENIKRGRTVVGFKCSAISSLYVDESTIPQNVKNKARMGRLRIESKCRELTPEEAAEYERLAAAAQQIELKF